MKSIVLLAVILAVFAPASVYSYECFVFAEKSLFNLCPFSKIQADTQVIFEKEIDGKKLTFKVGTERLHGCDAQNATSFTWATLSDSNTCEDLASHSPSYSLLNSADSKEGFKMTFPAEHRDDAIFSDATNQIVINFKCNMNEVKTKETPFNLTKTEDPETGNIVYTLDGESRFGCPALPFEQLLQFIQENEKYAAPVLAVAGLVLTFFGLKFINFAIFTITAAAGTFVSGITLYQFTGVTVGNWVFWVIVVVSTVLGVAVGYLALKLEKAAVFVVGAFFGGLGGTLLFAAFGSSLVATGNTTPLYVTVVLAGLIGGALAFVLFETVFILATSLIGSASIFYALSTFVGHFPSSISSIAGLATLDVFGYAYLAGIVILMGVGTWYQHKNKGKKKEEDLESGSAPKQGYAYYRY